MTSLFETATQHLVGGVNSPVRAFNSVGGHPVFIQSGSGTRIKDVNGKEYIDYVGSYGPLILGHVHPQVLEAVTAAASKGFSFGATAPGEIELAKLLKAAIPGTDLVRFVNSGTEATMSAIRLARAFTDRDKVIKFAGCYHGHEDNLLVAAGSGVVTFGLPGSAGVPDDVVKDTLVALYNDINSVKTLVDQFPDTIAAIIIEPVAGNMGVVEPAPGFLKALRELASANGIVLIVDEVMTGFRSQFGVAHHLFDIQADITCLGKVIGGGFPVGAYCGRKEIMAMVAPLGNVYQAGTLSGNPVAMAAGLKTLEVLRELNPYQQFEQQTVQLKTGIEAMAQAKGIPVQVNHFGSMINVFFTDQPVVDFATAQTSDTHRFAKFFWGMMEQGIFLPPSQFEAWFLSALHGEAEIEATLKAIGTTFEQLA